MSTNKKAAPAIQSLTLSPKQVASVVRHLADKQVSMFLWGPPGIGKSQVIKAMATELGMGFVDIRLSQMDPTDIRGILLKKMV
jgi:MoxR-like ATPase